MYHCSHVLGMVVALLLAGAVWAQEQEPKAWLGAEVQDVSKDEADKLGWDRPARRQSHGIHDRLAGGESRVQGRRHHSRHRPHRNRHGLRVPCRHRGAGGQGWRCGSACFPADENGVLL